MRLRLVVHCPDIIIVIAQADVVVATNVIEPGGAFELVRQTLYPLVKQPGIFCRDRIPQQCHECGVIGYFAFLGIDGIFAEVFDDFNRGDDSLGNE